VQIDFSATPYNQVGTPKKARKVYFPHISVDFELKTAMRTGLVKSLVLDKRKEIGALPLEFKAERNADGKPILSEGQRVMLRAGLAKLIKLETDFAKIDSQRFPKMLVVCEDTYVTPHVVAFFQEEGLKEEEIMAIDSTQKGELKPSEWLAKRERLFDVDSHASPRVIVSVLMLREGFDVNNICVIVPLRTTGSIILLEQTIGRGLRLMWRELEYSDIKQENRRRINQGKEPQSLIDILSIVEHPAFQYFYDELMQEGLVGTTSEESEEGSSTGDLITVGLREDYATYDFAIPFILREAEQSLQQYEIDYKTLAPFDTLTLPQLNNMIGKGDVFTSQDVQSKTWFGDYRVDGGIMTATGYNDFVARLTNRLSAVLSAPITKSAKTYANKSHFPYLQINQAKLAGWIDNYIRHRLFNTHFIPLENENWRVLLLDVVAQHIITTLARALLAAENTEITALAEVTHRYLSEVPKLIVRESASLPVNKCIYERLPYPTKSGGFEKSFIELANHDGQVEAFCKINEQKQDFARLRYVKEDGLPAYYSPDFLVRTQSSIYLVETKAQAQMNHPNIQRKQRAAVACCDSINELTLEQRQKRNWHYVLLGEDLFYEWRDKNARLNELLQFAKLRPLDETKQARLW
jgi:type III restriction enzyme